MKRSTFKLIKSDTGLCSSLPRTQTSLFWWKCARKGRREGDNGRDVAKPSVCTLPMVPCGSWPVTRVSRSPLPCEKQSAWGGGWCSIRVRWPLAPNFCGFTYKSYAGQLRFYSFRALGSLQFPLEHSLADISNLGRQIRISTVERHHFKHRISHVLNLIHKLL